MTITVSRRRWTAAGAVLAVAASGLIAAGLPAATAAGPAPAAPSSDAQDKISDEVQQTLADQGRASAWVDFADRADLGSLATIADRDQRGWAVYDALTQLAETSQAEVRAELDALDVRYTAYWGANVIRVTGATPEELTAVAASPDVSAILPEAEIALPEPEPGTAEIGPSAVEWGVTNINADDVWTEFGVRGEGIVVATVDSGVQFDHPALVDQYRGNNGDGTFDHDYNWLDAAGGSPGEPSDFDGHGTHVTGTMVGDDGGGNQIGVAPGAQWIAANGCCPSDEALLDSMQWMLAPTRLDGSDPDPTQRPHVVNNSWGTLGPSNDPFGEDIQEAWEASGILGTWSNGNNAPGCETSGSPGSRTLNYSAGAYDIDDEIADFSSRGAGQDGETKPNIAAPGVNVRSSVPQNGYELFSGTSMAAPHLAGAVALVWSAAPALVGDIPATKALLDGTAIDTPDDECGGTDADNNVYGEGRLDALALIEAAPTDDAGRVTGTVTDAQTSEPVADAAVVMTGPSTRTLTTGADGTFAAFLQAGEYEVQVSAFGYETVTETLTLEAGEEAQLDVALTPAEVVTLSGVVTDGSGHGWPLYAMISVAGTPVTTYTDPVTGEYSLEVPTGTWTLEAVSMVPGYQTGSAEVSVTEDTEQDFALLVLDSCTAPGYGYTIEGTTETFDDGIPDTWQVVDNSAGGGIWSNGSESIRENETGGEGDFAIADSDSAGPGVLFDTELISPALDFSAVEAPSVIFTQSYLNLGDLADVDLSLDGGATWSTVLNQSSSSPGPDEVTIAIPEAGGLSDVHVRFRYYNADWAWYWQVDDVVLGSRVCEPDAEGGLVVGNVRDNAGEGINGATVIHDVVPEVSGTTVATPDDENLDDGYYWLFAPSGPQPFTASARNYGTDSGSVDVVADDAVLADWVLGSGQLSLTPESFEFTLAEGETDGGTLTITNDGDVDANVVIRELPERVSTSTQEIVKAATGAPLQRVETEAWIGSVTAAPEGAPAPVPDDTAPTDAPWTDMAPFPVPVQDHAMVNLDGVVHVLGGVAGIEFYDDVWVYDDAADTWSEGTPLPGGRENLVAAVADGQIYAGSGWEENGDVTASWWGLAPDGGEWTELAPMPTGRSAAAAATVDGQIYVVGGCSTADCSPMLDDVSVYDPAADEWTTLEPYPGGGRAYVQCGGIIGQLVCVGGVDDGSAGTAEAWSYDPAADEWTQLPDAPNERWGGSSTEANAHLVVTGGLEADEITNDSFAFDGAGGDWIDLPNSNNAVFRGAMTCGIVKVGGGLGDFEGTDDVETLPGFDLCSSVVSDVPWLDEDPVEVVVPAGGTAEVEVTVDSTGLVPGVYASGLRFQTDTPDGLPDVPVTLTVERTYERWGGANRYETAALLTERFEPGVGNVIVATGQNHPDALAGSAHAGSFGVPVLLVQGGNLPRVTAQALERLAPENITVLGGDTAVSDSVVEALGDYTDGDVTRIEGRDRYETATLVAALQPEAETVYVATGVDFPDALAAAARAGALDGPVLLTKLDTLPRSTRTALEALAPADIRVVGGDEVVSDAVTVELREYGDVVRTDGDDRYHTAMLLSDELETSDRVFVATGLTYPDALTASAWAGEVDAPLLLAQQDNATNPTRYAVARLNPNTVMVLGGQDALADSVAEELRDIREAPRPPDPARVDEAQ